MKKKICCLTLLLGFVCLAFLGCGQPIQEEVKDNLSELTKTYYFAECEEFYVSLSSGEREENYLMNGKSEKKVDFALLSLKPSKTLPDKVVEVNVSIDGIVQTKELEINGLNGCYMTDLEHFLTGKEKVVLTYNNISITLENLSENFIVDDEKAVEIASKELQERLLKEKKNGFFNAECYLRILDKKANDFEDVFWCFTVVNADNENYSVIISTVDGSILAKSV